MCKSIFMNFRALVLAVSLVLLPLTAIAQTTISGVVRETNGEPIPGASVREKGTTNGAATDLDGKFSFKVSDAKATIVVSFVGYQTQEFALSGRKNLTITLLTDDELLDDVVVVGYGTMKKKLVTGATVQVKGEDIAKMNTTNALTAMQSQTPGVNITQSSTQPGKGFKVNIRGAGTIAKSSPLLIIDGIVSGTADDGLNGLNPNDIERIDVLKDAASAAIYGARAANGVILVTTKQGKEGKLSLQYDGYVGWSNAYKRPATLGAQDYMKVINETSVNTTGKVVDWASMMPAEIYQKINGTWNPAAGTTEQYPNIQNGWNGTDWWKTYENKNAVQTSHAVSLTGGTDRSKFAMGVNYSSNEGVMGGDNASTYSRYGGRINSEHVLLRNAKGRDIITLGENISYWYHKSHQMAEGNGYWNAVKPVYSASPLVPCYNADGTVTNYNTNGAGWSSMIFNNPLNGLQNGLYNGLNDSRDFGVGATFFWVIEPIVGLKYRGSVNTGYSGSNYRNFAQPYSVSSTDSRDSYDLQMGENQSSSVSMDNTITYTFQNLGKHALDIMVGQSFEKNMWSQSMFMNLSTSSANANSLLMHGWDYAIAHNYATDDITGFDGTFNDDWAIASFFGRLNYNYDEKYMFTAILRRDGSSNFKKGKRWGTFPSFSGGWTISNEKFMESTKSWLDSFKIRASWGQNGNCDIDNYQYLANIAYSPTNYADYGYKFGSSDEASATGAYKGGAYAANMANEEVSWETSEQVDLGFDATFLQGRLSLSFDWYVKTTKDWLVAAPIQAIYGYPEDGAPYINGGNVRNRGFEIATSWKDRIGKDFNYHAGVNIAINKNEVTKIANANGYINGPTSALFQNSDYFTRVEVGHPIGYFYGMSYSGLWQNEAQIQAARNAGKAVLDGAVPGDPIWDDHDGNGVIEYDNDRHEIGNPHPDVTLGFNLGFDYKGFDFGIQAYGAFGMQVMQCYRTALLANQYVNYTTDAFDRWHGEGTSNSVPRLTLGHSNDQWVSTRYMQNADYLRIQNVTVGYDFNKIWKNSPFGQLRLYAQIQNLMTFTGYTGVDPEIGSAGGQDDYTWMRGIDLGLYPPARTFLLGVNIKF